MTDKILVLTTCAGLEEAEALARRVMEKRLAACVNLITAVRSIYHWRGQLEEGSETLLLIKSRRGLFEQLRAELERHHSYEVPEVLALAVTDGSRAYLDWLDHELKPAP